MSRPLLFALLTLSLVACGGVAPGDRIDHTLTPPSRGGHHEAQPEDPDSGLPPGEETDAAPGPTQPATELARRSWARIGVATQQAQTVSALAIRMARQAAKLTASPAYVTSGTLYEPTSLDGTWRYAQLPADELRVRWADGSTSAFVFETLTPNSAEYDSSTFLKADHDLSFSVYGSREDYEISSRLSAGELAESSFGHTRAGAVQCTWDVQATTTYGSAEVRNVSGTVDCGVETASFASTRTVGAAEVPVFDLGEAEQFHYVWTGSIGTWELSDGLIALARDDNGPYAFQARGTITRNGEKVGGLSIEDLELGELTRKTAWVEVEDGRFPLRSETLHP